MQRNAFCRLLALLYVWHVERKYAPARKWAIGSLLLALGTLLIALGSDSSPGVVIVARSLIIYIGLFIFGFGIVEACGSRASWRVLAAMLVLALVAHVWFSLVAPSVEQSPDRLRRRGGRERGLCRARRAQFAA